MKIKILFVLGIMGTNGVTKSLLSLLKALPQDKYDISLFLFVHDPRFLPLIPSHIKILHAIPEYEIRAMPLRKAIIHALKVKRFDLLCSRVLAGFYRRRKCYKPTKWNDLPDVLGDWDIVCSYADGWLSSMVVKKIPNGKKVLWVHENYEDNPKSKEVLESFLQADAIVGVSHDAVCHLSNLLGSSIARKLYVVHNIVDSKNVKSLANSEKVSLVAGAYNLISVGRVSYEKGYDLIPAILQMLVQRGFNVHWSIIGDGVASIKDSIISEAKRQGVDGRIHFLGGKDNPHPYTKVADCFVQLSRHEGWCMTITEALALGVPVVVSDLPVFHEQVVEGVNGFFAHDISSFAEAISAVLSHKNSFTCSISSPCEPLVVRNDFNELMSCLAK